MEKYGVAVAATIGAAIMTIVSCLLSTWFKEWRAVLELATGSRSRNLKLTPLQLDAVRAFIQGSNDHSSAVTTRSLNPAFRSVDEGSNASIDTIGVQVVDEST